MDKSYQVPMSIVSIKEIIEDVVVYNFSVDVDETYILNGVVSHNCRCQLAPATADLPEAPRSNETDFETWLNS